MSERTYKRAFVSSAVICLALAGTLAYVIWGRTYLATATDNASPVVAKGPDVPRTAGQHRPFVRRVCIPHSSATVSAAHASHWREDCAG